MRRSLLFFALFACTPDTDDGTQAPLTCADLDIEAFPEIHVLSADAEMFLVPGERSHWSATEGEARECSSDDGGIINLFDVGQINLGPDVTVSLADGVSALARRSPEDPTPIHVVAGDGGAMATLTTAGGALSEVRVQNPSGQIFNTVDGPTFSLDGPSALWPTTDQTLVIEGSHPDTLVSAEWTGTPGGQGLAFSGQAAAISAEGPGLGLECEDLDGALEASAIPGSWTVEARGLFARLHLEPRDDVDLALVLDAGTYTFDCDGPCPELPAGIIDGEGPLVEVIAAEGWSGSLEVMLSP